MRKRKVNKIVNGIELRECSKCLQYLSLDYFYKRKGRKDLRHHCKNCMLLNDKEYYALNIDTERSKRLEYYYNNMDVYENNHMLTKFGITMKEKNELFNTQDGKCAICLKNIDIKTANTDHEHIEDYNNLPQDEKKQYVRGLLCRCCNLSKVGSNTLETAIRVVEYLQRHKSEMLDLEENDEEQKID